MRTLWWKIALVVAVLVLSVDTRGGAWTLGVLTARADDCRESLAQAHMEQIRADLPSRMTSPRVEECEIRREGDEIYIRVHASVLVWALGLKDRFHGEVAVMLNSDCTSARVVSTSVSGKILKLLKADWREALTDDVVRHRNQPPLAQYCAR